MMMCVHKSGKDDVARSADHLRRTARSCQFGDSADPRDATVLDFDRTVQDNLRFIVRGDPADYLSAVHD